MKLYTIDRDYFDYIFNKVDKEVMFSHTEEKNKGRANVWVKRMQYKGHLIDFAVPEKGDIYISEKEENFVKLSIGKQGGKFVSGFVVSKLMPIESSLLIPYVFDNTSNFRQIATEITRKELELIAKTKAHLRKLEEGKKPNFSTDVDKQLMFLVAFLKLRRMGESEKTIYGRSFADNVRKANGC